MSFFDDRTTGDAASQEAQKRRMYAHFLQSACHSALEKARSSCITANSNWAFPLFASPSIFPTVVVLFKNGAARAAAGLEIESQEVKDVRGQSIGLLPSKSFHTNLQHCSEIGGKAFQDAQHYMGVISRIARSMIEEHGRIGYIIDMLEDLSEAKHNLKPEIEAITVWAKKCQEAAQAIVSKFKYWYLVITHLKMMSLSMGGEVVKEKEKAKRDMQQRNNYNDVEFDPIIEILDKSVKRLGRLKEQIEPLIDFFRVFLDQIDHDVDQNLQSFLQPILRNIKESSTSDEVEAINLSKKSKERIISVAFQIQARFSVLSDVAGAYIQISIDYIRPAITQMERLSNTSGEEWSMGNSIDMFAEWCEEATSDIEGVTIRINKDVDRNMVRHVNELSTQLQNSASGTSERYEDKNLNFSNLWAV